jgi:hypothetical protein
VAFQYDVSFIWTSALFAGLLSGTAYSSGLSMSDFLQVSFVFVPITLGILFIARSSVPEEWGEGVFFALGSAMVFGGIVLPKQLLNVALAPQPIRYVPEFDISLILVIGFVAFLVIQLIANTVTGLPRPRLAVKRLLTVLLLLGLIFNASVTYLPSAVAETTPSATIANVPEVAISNWLGNHVSDQRVFATGTICFWLDVFSNVSEIRGGSDQGATNTYWANVTYEINTGSDPQLSILWAKAWNVQYIVVIFPNASTPYRDYLYPNKFQGILSMPYYYSGFGIYEVPLTHPQLVQAVSAKSAQALRPIKGIKDTRDLSAYVGLLETPKTGATVTYAVPNPDEISIAVTGATADTALIVKMTNDQNWQATAEGQPVAISTIGSGFMVLYPGISGNYQLTLVYSRSNGLITGVIVGIAIIVVLAFAPAVLPKTWPKRKRAFSTRP